MKMEKKLSELEFREAISKYLKLDICQITHCHNDKTGCVVRAMCNEIKIDKEDVDYAIEKYRGE